MIGNRVKKARIKLGMTQTELGNKIGVSKVSISGYEDGTKKPKMKTFLLLVKVLNVSADYLLGKDVPVVIEHPAITEHEEPYIVNMSHEEVQVIMELRNHKELYNLVTNDPIRVVERISRKIH